MRLDNNQQAFFALLRAGLWEQDVQLLPYGDIDFSVIYKLAEEQSVVGLIAAGLEHVIDTKVPKKEALAFVGYALQLEKRNSAMNSFVGYLVEKLRDNNIYTILVKGQGIAQCYDRPLWRSSGDVDYLLDESNYLKAKLYLGPLASKIDQEDCDKKHQGLTIDTWDVELHGTLHSGLWKEVDKTMDALLFELFLNKKHRVWNNNTIRIYLPDPNYDVVIVFSHILQHFFRGGIGLRQICDLSRLLWTYKDIIKPSFLKESFRKMRVESEWNAFMCFLITYLGMPAGAAVIYKPSAKWNRKAKKILDFIWDVGNFGHNRNYDYYNTKPKFIIKVISFSTHTWDSLRYFRIFPLDAVKVWLKMILVGTKELVAKK